MIHRRKNRSKLFAAKLFCFILNKLLVLKKTFLNSTTDCSNSGFLDLANNPLL